MIHVFFFFMIALSAAFTNPILPGFNPDPSIVRVGDDYYVATSTFEFYPGVPIYRSKDLVHWELISHALNRKENLPLYGTAANEGIWAPTLRFIHGRFYMTTMTRWVNEPTVKLFPRIFWTSSVDLVNWTPLVWAEPWGIDPDLFLDPANGRTYLTLMSIKSEAEPYWGIYQCQVDLDNGRCTSDFNLIFSGTLPNTLSARPEGPHIYKVGDWYYLMLAEGGTGATHQSSIVRSSSPSGPWEPCPWNPLISNYRFGTNLTVGSTGHADMIEGANGHWYAVFLARRNVKRVAHLGRETFLTEVVWEDEWPVFNHRQPIVIESNITGIPPNKTPPASFYDDFSAASLDLGYYHVRTPYTQSVALTAKNKRSTETPSLQLFPNVYNMSHRDSAAALLRRQKSLNMTFSAGPRVPNTPFKSELQEVGISLYLSENNHQDIAVVRCPLNQSLSNSNEYCISVSLNEKGTFTKSYTTVHDTTNLAFHIRAEPRKYSFGYSLDSSHSKITWLSTIDNEMLNWSPFGGSGFTGLHWAIYGTGNGKPWPYDGGDVGFKWVKEEYYEEHIPDYDVWT